MTGKHQLRVVAVVCGVVLAVGVSLAAGSPLVSSLARQVGSPGEVESSDLPVGEQLEREIREPDEQPLVGSVRPARPATPVLTRPSAVATPLVGVTEDAAHSDTGETASTAPTEITELSATDTGQAEPVAPASAPTTTVAPVRRTRPTQATPTTKAPTTTAAPTTRAPATTAAPTTAAPTTQAPVAAAPSGSAGHGGAVGCQSNCQNIGFQNLDNSNGVTLENVIISNPNGRCISARNATNLTLRNVTIENCGTNQAVWDGYDAGMIDIQHSSNITIEHSIIRNISARHHSSARNNAIQIMNSPNIRIYNNLFQDIHSDISQKTGDNGNRSISVQGGNSHNVKIERNTFTNAGRNALQIKQARNLSGISFSHNIVQGRGPWNSDYEDMVNMYSSSGRSGDPIVIRGNYMRNGGSSISGTAIIAGDGNTGAGPSQFILVERNVIVNPGHVGINLAGGDNIVVRDNLIYGDQNVPHSTTVGLIINHFGYSHECKNHVVTGNRVYMRNQHHNGNVNHVWITGSCGNNVRVEGNNFGDTSLNGGIWNP